MNKRQRKKLKKKIIKINKARWLAKSKLPSFFFPENLPFPLEGYEHRYGEFNLRDVFKEDLKK
jgi:hypothetical protein